MGSIKWSESDILRLIRFYERGSSIKSVSKMLKRSEGAIRNKAYKLGITSGTWSEEDVKNLKLSYKAVTEVSSIATKLDRSFASIVCKAHELQITKSAGMHVVTEKNKQKSSDRMKRRMSLGRIKTTGWSKSGLRQDLGIYFRSTWEANYARYLNVLVDKQDIKCWEYEPVRFEFDNIKRGTRSYLPDFRVLCSNGDIEWHEVKGYMTRKGRTALRRFCKYYPEETLVLIDKKAYKSLEKNYSSSIDNWEK